MYHKRLAMFCPKTNLWHMFGQKSSLGKGRTLVLSACALGSEGLYTEMIPSWIRKQLFDNNRPPSISVEKFQSRGASVKGRNCSESSQLFRSSPGPSSFQNCSSDLAQQWVEVCLTEQREEFDLPGLSSRNLSSYFTDAAIGQVDHYCTMLKKLIVPLKPMPLTWLLQPGWTIYKEGHPPRNVHYPDENVLILDVEVCVKDSWAPVLATAVSPDAWYCWVSPSLFQNGSRTHNLVQMDDLISLGDLKNEKRIVVGHYVVYDAVRLKDSYCKTPTGLRFFDTMAAHISISGITNLQKFLLTKGTSELPWAKLACGNSLGHLYHLYCGRYLDKSQRNTFVEGSLTDVLENFQVLTTYCAQDVVATHSVFCKLYPLLLERFPHPVTLAAMLEMASMYMPVSKEWPNILHEEKENTVEIEKEINLLLHQMAKETCELLHNNKYLEDPWMWDQNWSVKTLPKSKKQMCRSTKKEGLELNLEDLMLDNSVSKNVSFYVPVSPNPEWYQKITLKDSSLEPELCLTLGMNITPKLLQLCWGPYPLHFLRGHGWGMLVPTSEMSVEAKSLPEESVPVKSIYKMCNAQPKLDLNSSYQDLTTLRTNIENFNSNASGRKRDAPESTTEIRLHSDILFRKLPHGQGIGRNVGSPFTKDLINNPAVCSKDSRGQRILTLLRRKQFWNKYCDKFESLPVAWSVRSNDNAAIIPETVVTGDFIRYPKEELLSALCSEDEGTMNLSRALCSPPGWLFLSASIPESTLWMSTLLSDSISGRYGGTLFGEMVFSNTFFSSLSNVMQVTEEEAKWLTHAVLFGGQRGFVARMLREIDPSLSKLKALGRADRLLEFLLGVHSQAQSCLAQNSWQGGVLSELWSKLNVAASKIEVVTPVLGSRMSRVLESDTDRFSALVMSWIIQSSSVDLLHLLLTSFRDLAPYARLSLISSQMDIYYLVPEHEKYHAAKSLHLAHLYAKAFCASRVGMNDLPMASAFLPHVLLSCYLKPTKQDKVLKLNFKEAHQRSLLSGTS